MRVVFAIALVVGVLALFAWIVAATAAEIVSGWERLDPERGLGPRARSGVAAILGFGMAGLSAAYAGWPGLAAVSAALAGAAAGYWLARRAGPRPD